ncbi:MAG TPA: M56 family metallopeptidase [Gemmatimonadales bacterium]|jgi:beta-lactamase regulating signal transducer with metallopeptidase domain
MLLAARTSLLFAAAFLVTLVLRRSSAASRHAVWLAAFAGVLALPAATTMLPSLRLRLLPDLSFAGQQPVVAQSAPVVVMAASGARPKAVAIAHLKNGGSFKVADGSLLFSGQGSVEAISAARHEASPWPWSAKLLLVWLTGAVMVGAAFAIDVMRTHLLACSAVPEGDLLAEEAEVIAASLGIARDVRLVTWDGPAMPMTWGALRPVVLLPEAAREWTSARRREVLMHELAHVRRGDWAARLLAAVVCAVHWFNPLAWMAARRLRDEQELACDDAVLAGGACASDYAANLLEVARSLRSPAPGLRTATVAMARPSQLTGRLLAILDETRNREPVSAGRTGRVAALLTILLAVPLAAMVPVRRLPASGSKIVLAAGHGIAAGVSSGVTGGVSRLMDGTLAAQFKEASGSYLALSLRHGAHCDMDTRRRGGNTSASSHSDSEDDAPRLVSLSLHEGDCSLEVRIIGSVRFSDDESDISDLPRGASVRVIEDNHGVETRFDATWQNGALQRRWRQDGADVQETAELREWLGWALQTAFSRTGYDAVPRMLRAYRAGGLDSALKLTSTTESDYSKRIMLMALIDSTHVPPADAARIARQTESMSSDYERAELLIAVATRVGLDAGVQDAMVNASSHISSDYERGRVLTAALARPGLSTEAAASLIRSAAGMSSDHEKVELLIRYLQDRPIPDAMRSTFFAASGSISSDYEHRRLLTELLKRQDTPIAVVGDVCEQAAKISSDYERAELLVTVATKFGSSADARNLVRHAAQGISSDYERNRVMSVLGTRE